MLKTGDMKKVLHTFLTGVTAGYALALNRAAVFLVDPEGKFLEGRMALGERIFWDAHSHETYTFQRFVSELEADRLPRSRFDEEVCKLRIPIVEGQDLLSDTFLHSRWTCAEAGKSSQLPAALRAVFSPSSNFMIGPLIASRPLGVLIADNEFSSAPITRLEQTVLMAFSHRAAVTLQNRLTFEDLVQTQERVQKLHKASAHLLISEAFEEIARNAIDLLKEASDASSVQAILVDEMGQLTNSFGTGELSGPEVEAACTKIVNLVKDGWQDPAEAEPQDCRQICIPIRTGQRLMGGFNIGYNAPRRISMQEINTLHLFGQQAGSALDAALKFGASHLLASAARIRPSNDSEHKQLLQTILTAAKAEFAASSVSLWPCRADLRFVQQNLATSGLSDNAIAMFRNHEPAPAGLTAAVLERGYIEISDVEQCKEDFLLPKTKELILQAGIKAFQAALLRVDQQPQGVLYVSHVHSRVFQSRDRSRLTAFANAVAQLLHHAKLHLEATEARRAAQALAEMTALSQHDPANVFKFISEKAHELLHCDIISLYTFDEAADRIANPYYRATTGEVSAKHDSITSKDEWIHRLMLAERPLVIPKVDEHPVYAKRPFAMRHGIKTFLALPLRASGRRVGLMFVNYCDHHVFTDEEQKHIAMVGHQVAVAIRNAQLFEEGRAFERLSGELLACRSVQQIADVAAKRASEMLGSEFSDVVLKDPGGNDYYRAVGYVNWPSNIEEWTMTPGTGSQTGYTIQQSEPVIVNDFRHEKRFSVREAIKTLGIVSAMSTRLLQDGEPIGALLVHSTRRRKFGPYETDLLQHIGNETAAAMQGRRLFEAEAERRATDAHAILDALKAINQQSRGLDTQAIFSQILQQAVKLAGGEAFFASLHRYHADNKTLTMEAVFPPAEYERIKETVGTSWSIEKGYRTTGLIGIVGRAVKEGTPQLEDDVSQCKDWYLPLNDGTQSELAVPLFDESEPAGVINLESRNLRAFKPQHQQLITALGHMITIVMRNVRDYEELKDTITRLDARNALAWITTTKNYWGHALVNATYAVRNNLDLLKQDLAAYFSDGIPDSIISELQEIAKLIQFAESKPVTPPLSSEEGLMPVYLNHLLREKLSDCRENYKDIRFDLELQTDDASRILISEEWLIRAIDLVIGNAVHELQNPAVPTERRRIVVKTRKGPRAGVEICFRDLAFGIPEHIRPKVFVAVIKKGDDDPGLGIGMLMVRTIVETYRGKVRVAETGSSGTEIVMWFPPKSE
jgi:GAF domain-containing protein